MKRNWTIADVARHWDSVPQYDGINKKIDSYMRRFSDSAPLFEITNNAKVLDIDCRTAVGTCFFKKLYPTAQYTCMAMASSFEETARKRLKENGISADLRLFESLPLPFENGDFDAVLTYETIEHVPSPKDFINELSRVLKSGGVLVLSTPNVLWEPVHWLSNKLKLDHGEGPHMMVKRKTLLKLLNEVGLEISKERSFVLVPAGPNWLIAIGKVIENVLPERIRRILCLRRTFVCRRLPTAWSRLKREVIDCGLCTQCGTCSGISKGRITFEERSGIPIPVLKNPHGDLPNAIFSACPARTCLYPELNRFVFGKIPLDWLCGVVEKSYTGHASDDEVRLNAASGGIISALLIDLLERKEIAGAVCLKLGKTYPWKAEPVIAHSKEEVLECAQSVYSLTPVNTILDELSKENAPLAYIGLPDQVASIRKLQMMNHPSVKNIKYVFGPYMGTQMYFEAIRSFLRSNGVDSEKEIAELKYRAGEWPGNLYIKLRDGRELTAEKFHYNYLIPFYITSGSLQLADFTNELTDISVGDAWSPKFEKERGGHSVILARTNAGVTLLESMRERGLVELAEIQLEEALDMHGHMLDFKKRGSFVRNGWKKIMPDYGYRPAYITFQRISIEWFLCMFFAVGRTRFARRAIEFMPLKIIGPLFNITRKSWKAVSKPTKRKGLKNMKFVVSE